MSRTFDGVDDKAIAEIAIMNGAAEVGALHGVAKLDAGAGFDALVDCAAASDTDHAVLHHAAGADYRSNVSFYGEAGAAGSDSLDTIPYGTWHRATCTRITTSDHRFQTRRGDTEALGTLRELTTAIGKIDTGEVNVGCWRDSGTYGNFLAGSIARVAAWSGDSLNVKELQAINVGIDPRALGRKLNALKINAELVRGAPRFGYPGPAPGKPTWTLTGTTESDHPGKLHRCGDFHAVCN